MKYLLHSKKFKKKLAKWIMSYIGILCLLTCVITYSRYISRVSTEDTARVAKFDITISNNGSQNTCDTGIPNQLCYKIDQSSPVREITDTFTIDASNTETSILLATTITINDTENYKIKEVKDKTNDTTITCSETICTINENINANASKIRTYEVTTELIKYSEISEGNYTLNGEKSYLNIGYSLKQID